MRTQRPEAAHRPGPGTLPALERQPRRPRHLGTAATTPINPARTPGRTDAATVNWPRRLTACPSQDFRILTTRVLGLGDWLWNLLALLRSKRDRLSSAAVSSTLGSR